VIEIIKHYSSFKELDKDIETGVYDTPTIKITPQDWLILCSKINGCRRTKTLKPWEFKQAREGQLAYCLGKQNDIIIFTDIQKVQYKCKVSQIQQDWDGRINVMQISNRAIIPLYRLVIESVRNKKDDLQQIKRVKHRKVKRNELEL